MKTRNKPKFVRTIGRCAWNDLSLDIYQNTNGAATIRPCKFGHDLPTKKWVNFDSIDALESFIDDISKKNNHSTGLNLVIDLLQHFGL